MSSTRCLKNTRISNFSIVVQAGAVLLHAKRRAEILNDETDSRFLQFFERVRKWIFGLVPSGSDACRGSLRSGVTVFPSISKLKVYKELPSFSCNGLHLQQSRLSS
jgi:hypothetical protein